jgi:tight adherence protein C
MSAAARRVRLGAGWVDALARAEEPSLRGLGASLGHAEELGLPVADALERFAHRGRAEAARRFEESIRKAPVKMMMPLTLCVLPSFILLGVAPFLRSLSLG